jgi:hypothetical protein
MSRWTTQQAQAWYAKQPWRVGANFIPSNAINQLEMWQADTFDLATIERELSWAAAIGMNTARVYLHDLLWQEDADEFSRRIDQFLAVAAKLGISPMLVIFDDCWNAGAALGKQPESRTGIHNSGWLQSPGVHVVNDPAQWPRLEKYVKELLHRFDGDERILLWDLYNEPGNNKQREKSLPLLQATFDWAHEVRPSQPLSVGVWFDCAPLNEFQLAASDVITFHNYNDADNLRRQIEALAQLNRGLICTEWLRRAGGTTDGGGPRTGSSRVETHLPIFRQHNVGCINWGLVAGKTQTIYPWGSPEGSPEPAVWFHDLFRPDGTPFDTNEIECFKDLTGKQ